MKIVIVAMPVMTLAMNITTLAVVWYGGNIIIAGDMPVGDLTAFTTYIVQILMSLMMLSMVFLQLSRAVASIRRVSEVMEMCIRDRVHTVLNVFFRPGIHRAGSLVQNQHRGLGYGCSGNVEKLSLSLA